MEKSEPTFLMSVWLSYQSIVVSISAVVFTISFISTLKERYLKLPPGPKPWPLVGNLLLLGELAHQSLLELSKEYGPIMLFKMGSVRTIVVSSPELLQEILKTQDQNFCGRPATSVGEIFSHGRKNIMMSPYDSHWRLLRAVCNELFTAERIALFQGVRHEETLKTLQSMVEDGKGGNLVSIDDNIGQLMMNNMTRVLFNRACFKEQKGGGNKSKIADFQVAIRELFEIAGAFIPGDYIHCLKGLDIGGYEARLKRHTKRFDALCAAIIDEHRRMAGDASKRGGGAFLDVLLTAKDENALTNLQIRGLLGDMLLAGTDTSAIQTVWTMTELIRHPQILERVQMELDAVVGKDRIVEESDLSRLDYLQAVVKESFRLHPVAPLLVPHESVVATKVAGYDIPEKSLVLLNVYAIGRDPSVWKNPLCFDPERFVGTAIDMSGTDFRLLPFGAGRRICPAVNLGLLHIQFTLARLLQTCEFSLPLGVKAEELDVKEGQGVSTPRANPLKLLVTSRLPSLLDNRRG